MSVLTLEQALKLRHNRKLVFTNGVFDILHVGHVRLLTVARSLGDLLIVGINSDDSVRRLGKGPDRPIHTAELRAELLSALRFVDAVVTFDEDTPVALIQKLRPEVHVKGGDYRKEDLPEAHEVESYGGTVVIFPTVAGHSTTSILGKLSS